MTPGACILALWDSAAPEWGLPRVGTLVCFVRCFPSVLEQVWCMQKEPQ